MADNLFDNLNLNEREIRTLMQTPEGRQKMALRQLRMFYSTMLLDSGLDDEVLRLVNNDIDKMMNDPQLLLSEGRKYLENETRQPASVEDRLRLYQNRARESGERARELEEKLKESEDGVEPLETALQEANTSLGMFRDLLLENTKEVEGRVYIPDLQNFTYLVETSEKVQIEYRINEKLHLKKGRTNFDGGKFAGGIYLKDIPPEMFQRDSQSQMREFGIRMVNPTNPMEKELYHGLGRKLKPFVEKDMYIVTGAYLAPEKSSALHVYATVLEIKPK